MSRFKIYTVEDAPDESKRPLAESHNVFGFIPNVLGVMAEAPPLLKAYMAVWEFFDNSSLGPVERQVVYLAANYANSSPYSMAGHSRLAQIEGVPEEIISALRGGTPIAEPRLEALRQFTERTVETRGTPGQEETEAFLAAGFTNRNVLEVVLGIAIKAMSNYTNQLAETPLDDIIADFAWSKPTDTAA